MERKLANLEDKILNDAINGDTYKKGYKKFSMEIARLKSEIANLSEDITAKANEQIALIPELLRLPSLFERATLNQQHAILNRVFKQGLTFKDEGFRTPWFNPHFGHNYQEINKERLLETEQPLEDFPKIPFCGELGFCTHPNFLLYFDPLRVFNSVLTELLTTLNLVWYSCKCYIQI